MNLLPNEATELAIELNTLAKESKNTYFGVAPTFLSLTQTLSIKDRSIKIGAQNCHFEDSGAFTAEVSASMLKDVNTDFVIIGHSERRHVFSENQELITNRAKSVLDKSLTLVYCIGETLEDREAGRTLEVVKEQLTPVLELINDSSIENLILAYEPVWAIGTGKVASLDNINEVHDFIAGMTTAPILYGGSVKPGNYEEILNLKNVSGALVGGASLKFDSFSELFKISEN